MKNGGENVIETHSWQRLLRNISRHDQSGTAMDNLTYHYAMDKAGNILNNRLLHVNDAVRNNATTTDIKDQGNYGQQRPSTHNYAYDEVGNLIKDKSEQIAEIKWTVTGKVSDVTRTASSQKPDLHFDYDAMGQRIAKTVTNKNVTTGDKFVTTYYVRDPQGSVMAVYEHKHGDSDNGTFTLAEQHLYGAGRLGMRKRDLALNATNTSETPATYYELTNHLGNVMAVISDEVSDTNEPTVVSLSDYYPYGMTEPGRSWNAGAEGYRYGFNTQENVSELGEGHTTALYWEYDGRLGRRWNLDPKSNPMLSSYATFGCNPILLSDVLGDSSVVDSKGYFIGDIDENDRRVFMLESEGAEPVLIGEFGKTIDANPWFDNLLAENIQFAKLPPLPTIAQPGPYSDLDLQSALYVLGFIRQSFRFRDLVKEGGRFDYKYRTTESQDNLKREKGIEMEYADSRQHILGYAFYISDDSELGIGEGKADEQPTIFKFKGLDAARAQDLNNFHYGVIGKKVGFPELILKWYPGRIEQQKQEDDKKNGRKYNPDYVNWEETYGDNPIDAYFIREGIEYGR